jgi:hypothetical protein
MLSAYHRWPLMRSTLISNRDINFFSATKEIPRTIEGRGAAQRAKSILFSERFLICHCPTGTEKILTLSSSEHAKFICLDADILWVKICQRIDMSDRPRLGGQRLCHMPTRRRDKTSGQDTGTRRWMQFYRRQGCYQ